MNGSQLIAGCFRVIFGSRHAESTRSKFGVSAYSRINTVDRYQPSSAPQALFSVYHRTFNVYLQNLM